MDSQTNALAQAAALKAVPRRGRHWHRPSAFTEVHLWMQTPPCSCSYHVKQNSIQTDKRNLEEKRRMFHSSFHLEGEAIRSHATSSKGRRFFFSKCASLLLIRLHFLYCLYRICNFHQGKTNHSLTTFFQKCWEIDEYIVLTHLLNMNSGRAGQIHKLFLRPVFKHVLALTDMGRTLPRSLKKYRLKSCQCHSNSPDVKRERAGRHNNISPNFAWLVKGFKTITTTGPQPHRRKNNH